MDVPETDTINAVLAIRLELQDLATSLPAMPSHEEIAQTRDRISVLLFQLEELATLDAAQSNVRLQQSIYRAMLSDFPEVDRLLTQETDSMDGDENQQLHQPSSNPNIRVVGRHGYYEDPRIQPDGSTSLESYMHDLEADEIHPSKECYACLGDTPYSQLITREECEHVWCRPCLSERFGLALKDESQYPVRCCRNVPCISPASPDIVRLLGKETIAKLNLKMKEYETADRTYCHEPTCSEFIDPDTYINRMAPCPSCQRNTCVACKAAFHPHSECRDAQDEAFDTWKRLNEASTCPKCHRVILISHGCNHMK
ncbi:hypothetical protein AYL99_02476 [Fonsecaea erecta]|uniref:RBR-type E3 ubiquitin transferase n=1 Tax=Fonsecaea erecta TaxID=1367422 RepID=A0A178ZU05_9EURO|nr:hypothetical protein AYL99_02476 [Fonsecaea erecta]OAP63249.1 hypothetical protein AYL99_02476 [Fonsecaea erecta]